jgi:hypothetical protein
LILLISMEHTMPNLVNPVQTFLHDFRIYKICMTPIDPAHGPCYLVSSMSVSVLSLLVIVIDRARAGSCTRPDERTLPAADQRSRSCTDGCADTDAFRSLLFPGFRIVITPVSALAAGDGNCERKREHQQ